MGFPGLILFLTKKDDEFVHEQSKEALNWSITFVVIFIVSYILKFFVIGYFLILLLCGAHLVLTIWAAIATSNGKDFRMPFALRLLK